MQSSDSEFLRILKKYWGYDSFRPLQPDIIRSVAGGDDTLGLMPTGGGKSLTFQVPGMAFSSGVTIVVTPLISLMKDQVDNLKKRHIKAVSLHSGMTARETRLSWESLVNDNARFLYISPERLRSERFMQELRNIEVRLIVVDEAHCISQWGYDFRPAYLNIRLLRRIKPDVPVLALTATATPEVAEDIMRQLDFRGRNIFRKSFVRDNISYLVRNADTKIHEVFHILSRTSGSSIVYVRSRRRCREIADFLNGCDISSTFYHAGLDYSIKEERQNAWQKSEVRVMVATNAFGMGIDKPDVRIVIHYDMPPSLEEYYQEAGRAGRDGKPSFAVLLVSRYDAGTLRRRVSQAFPSREIVKGIYERVCVYMNLAVGEGYEKLRPFEIEKFCMTFNIDLRQCRNAIRLLGQAGYLEYIEEPDSRSRLRVEICREDLYHLDCSLPHTEDVLSAVLRLYPGLFSDYVYVREEEISALVNVNRQNVYESLLELSRMKVISYIPSSGVPLMYFPTSREEVSSVIIGKDIYEDRKDAMSRRTESMIDYACRNDSCRVERMLTYFGEHASGACRRCDVCRCNNSKIHHMTDSEAAEAVMSCLRDNPGGITAVVLERNCGCNAEQLHRAIRFLCGEGFVKCRDNLYFADSLYK